MPGEQAQQLAGDVARAAEDDGWTSSAAVCRDALTRRLRALRQAARRTLGDPARRASAPASASRSPVGAGVDRRHSELLLDDPRAHQVVGGRPGHRHRLDAVALAQHAHAAPGRHRIVGGEHHGGERGAELLVGEDRVDAVGAEQAVAQLDHDHVRAGRRRGRVSSVRVTAAALAGVVETTPRSVKSAVRRAPASSIASTSRRSETPVALKASTVKPACAQLAGSGRRPPRSCRRSCRSRRCATTGTPRRLERGATGSSGPLADPRRHADPLAEEREVRAPRPAPRTRTARPRSGLTESQMPSTPPRLSSWMRVAGRQPLRQVARVAEQRLAVARARRPPRRRA